MSKDKFKDYLIKTSNVDTSHIEKCINNLNVLKMDNIDYNLFEGCPQNFDLEDFIGLCELEENNDITGNEIYKLCENCWKKALNN